MSRARIGVSACFFHADPERAIFKGKTLLYFEQSMLEWVMERGGLPVLLPHASAAQDADDLVAGVEGLLLQGGSDVSPESYGAAPLRPEWKGDRVRDRYEISLVRAAMAASKPVLGICRGIQLLNVAFGGTLYQDVETQHEAKGAKKGAKSRVHRDWEAYDSLEHDITIESGSWLEGWYPSLPGRARVNSVHHQAIHVLGDGLVVEARSHPDGIIEAVRAEREDPFVYGVQWHPEFQTPAQDHLLPREPLLDRFFEQASRR